MKKLLLLGCLFLGTFFSQAQTEYSEALPNNGGTSQNGRAPQGAARYSKSVWLITAAEMAAGGFTNGTAILGLGFNYDVAQNTATTGTMKIYMQNTADATNTKSTTWATAITGMTTVSNGNITLPITAGTYDIPFAGGSPFTYTGGAVYVAFEYANPLSPVSTVANTALCNTALTGGLKGVVDATTPSATVAASNFRPETRLAKAVSCLRPTTMDFTAITETSATLSWTATVPAPGVGYDYYYSTSNVAPTAATTPSGSTGPTVTTANLSPLTSGTTYFVWVRAKCTAFATSSWSPIDAFVTTYSPAAPPYAEGFEAAIGGWTLLNAGTGNNWQILTNADAADTGIVAAEGTAYAGYVFNTTNAANAWLFSRRIAMTANMQYTISFKFNTPQTTTAFPENLKMTIGSDRTVAAQTTTLFNQTNIDVNNVWTQASATFTAPTTGNYVVGFNCYSAADMNLMAIDDFQISAGTAGVDEALASQFAVFPNPASNLVTIAGTDALVNGVELIDLNGRTVKTAKLNGVTEAQINISDLSAGVYMMNISSDKGKTTKKIVKQ